MLASISISRIIRIALLILFILALFGIGGFLTTYTILEPAEVWPGKDFWRIITYPIALSFGGLIVGSIVFGQPGEEIEGMFGKARFGLALLIVTLLVGGMHLLFFWGDLGPSLGGPMNISLFVLVGYVYLFPASSVTIFFFSVRSKIILWCSLGLAFLLAAMPIAAGVSPLVIFSEGMAGALIGFLWFHLHYQKYPWLLGVIRRIAGLMPGRKESISVHSPTREPSRVILRREEKKKQGGQILSDEERLNAILEKIGEKGYESLTRDEQKFLDEYSSNL